MRGGKKNTKRGLDVTSDEYFRENFSEDRSLPRRRISKLFRFGCHFGTAQSRYHPRASTSSLTRGKGLNNVARHKGQVSCAARHPRHFREKRTENPSALPPAPSSLFRRPRSQGKTYLGVLISFTRGCYRREKKESAGGSGKTGERMWRMGQSRSQ